MKRHAVPFLPCPKSIVPSQPKQKQALMPNPSLFSQKTHNPSANLVRKNMRGSCVLKITKLQKGGFEKAQLPRKVCFERKVSHPLSNVS